MIIYLQLFWSFCKIGFTSFGGLSMIPLISSEMLEHGWMTTAEISDIVAIAEMTPGPLGLNCASFAGIRSAGILGAVSANFGVLMPSITLAAAAAMFFERFKHSRALKDIMTGVRPACIAMIIGVCTTMSRTNYKIAGEVDLRLIILAAIDLFLLMKIKLSIPQVILISAAAGIVLFFL